MSVIKTATMSDAPKLEKVKFCWPNKPDNTCNNIALITKLNKPNVKNVIGKDNKCKIGFKLMFSMDNRKLAIIAIGIVLT